MIKHEKGLGILLYADCGVDKGGQSFKDGFIGRYALYPRGKFFEI